MNAFKRLIEGNRQTGTSTALIKAAKETKGYLIVGSMEIKHTRIQQHPELKGQVFTYYEVERGKCLGMEPGPVFFDTDCVWQLVTTKQNLEQKPNIVMLPEGMTIDGYISEMQKADDGYAKNSEQLNVKLTKEDMKDIKDINTVFFEGEAGNSMMGRLLVRKGIQFYKKLRDNF